MCGVLFVIRHSWHSPDVKEGGDGESRGDSTRKEGRRACDDAVREEHNFNEIVITLLKTTNHA